MIKTAFFYLMLFAWLILLFTPAVLAHSGQESIGAEILYDNALPVEKIPSIINIIMLNQTTGYPIPLEIVHERLLHVFIVSDDLQLFWHIHPDDFPEGMTDAYRGIYKVNHTFPTGGAYRLIINYVTRGFISFQQFNISVGGTSFTREKDNDFSNKKIVGLYEIVLDKPDAVFAGENTRFTYILNYNGTPVRDLQQYLGAETHVVILHENEADFNHIHSYVPGHMMHTSIMPQYYYGPAVPIEYQFPTAGTYVIYSQFKHHDEIITVKFRVVVEPAREKSMLSCVVDQLFNQSFALYILVACGILFILLIVYVIRKRK